MNPEISDFPFDKHLFKKISIYTFFVYFKECFRMWKIISLFLGIFLLIIGSVYFKFSDWDIGISFLMAILTYLFSPWSLSVLLSIVINKSYKENYHYLLIIFFLFWFTVDGSYTLYNELLNHDYSRIVNFPASSSLYIFCGYIWIYRGTSRELINDVLKEKKL